MTYEPPAPDSPEEELPQPQEPTPTPEELTPIEPTPEFSDEEEEWDDDEFLAQPAEDAYLAGDHWEGTPALPPRRSGGLASAIAVVLLAVALLAVTAWGIKLHRDKQTAAAAAGQLLGLVSEGAPAEMVKELSGIQADLTAGKMASANGRIALLRSLVSKGKGAQPEEGAPGAGEPLPADAYKDLPADAAQFFRANEDLFRRFLMLCTKSRELRDSGQNVDALRKIRDEIIEAARLGQKPAVQQKMLKMVAMLGGKAGPGDKAGGERNPLAAKAQQLRQLTGQAQREGRDLRPVFALMQQAEQAAQGGDMAAAGKFLDQALAAVGRAPKLSAADARRMRLGGRPGRGPAMVNPLAPFVRALLGVMGAEEQNLRALGDDLLSARGILFGQEPPAAQPELLKPILDKAMGQLTIVADRRKQLQMQMQQTKRPGGKPLLPPAQPHRGPAAGPMTEDQRKGMLQIVSARVGLVLDRVRAMSEEDYAKDRKRVVRDVMQAVFAPPTPEELAQLEGAKPAQPLTPHARAEAIRAKMLQASPTLSKFEIEGKDTQKIADLFTQARKDLYAGKLDDAEQAVNAARQLLGLTPPPPLGPAAGTDVEADPLKIDLRARPQ